MDADVDVDVAVAKQSKESKCLISHMQSAIINCLDSCLASMRIGFYTPVMPVMSARFALCNDVDVLDCVRCMEDVGKERKRGRMVDVQEMCPAEGGSLVCFSHYTRLHLSLSSLATLASWV